MKVFPETVRAAIVVGLCSLGLPGTVTAQSGTAALSGRVTDSQDSIVPGATVTLTNSATAASRTTVSNGSGLYQFPALPPGMYDLAVELTGFKAAKFEKIELRVDTAARQDVKLAVGQVSEAVTVQAETPIINTVDASLGNSISERQIRNLPIEARNIVPGPTIRAMVRRTARAPINRASRSTVSTSTTRRPRRPSRRYSG